MIRRSSIVSASTIRPAPACALAISASMYGLLPTDDPRSFSNCSIGCVVASGGGKDPAELSVTLKHVRVALLGGVGKRFGLRKPPRVLEQRHELEVVGLGKRIQSPGFLQLVERLIESPP